MSNRPFSNGSQFGDWQSSNCFRCKKYNEDYRLSCPIDVAIGMAYIGDGTVSEDIYKRMGADSNINAYVWMCLEADWTDEWKEEVEEERRRWRNE